MHPNLLSYLATRFDTLTSAQIIERMKGGAVIDAQGMPLTPDAPFVPQQRVYYYRHVEDEEKIAAQEMIIFEDDLIVVADKPHFLPVAPVGRYVQETLLVRLKRRLGLADLAPMHRIDLETAGLVCFTKQPHTRAAYAALFAQHKIQKRYEALALMPENFSLKFPITIENCIMPADNFMQSAIDENGKINAHTEIHLIGVHNGVGHFLLHPQTGKKHQLRLHMASIGSPILYDNIYPIFKPDAPRNVNAQLQLLAKHIAFVDPISGTNRSFESKRVLLIDSSQALV